ncbi:MAG: SBBP repeat-containing protein [Pirellulaceae bacterium]|nr:SBBP repeat-containing protein [Pirellulaceae bacterium]
MTYVWGIAGNLRAHLERSKRRERVAIKRLLTNVKFTTLQWGDVLRCAVRSGHDFHGANVDVDQLEARVLYSASPLPVEVVEVAQVDAADTDDSSTATDQDSSQSTGSDSTTTDDIRTSGDTLALLDDLSNELLPTLVGEEPADPGLLQFTTNGGNILGFTQDSILVASSSNLFDVQFVGANLVGPLAADSASNATAASSATGVASSAPVGAAAFTSVTYAGLWDGVTAVFDSQEGAILKSTYYVDAGLGGGAVDQIRLQYNRDVSLDAQGNLVISYDTGIMTDSAPVAWQDIDGQRIFIDVHYALLGDNQVGFTVGDYDHNYQLVIDPTLTWNTFIGGTGADYAQSIAVDSSGNVYVAGYTTATWGSPVRAFGGGGQDGFVAKLNSSGSLNWNTFLGGSGNADQVNGITVDSSGNVYVTGQANASWGTPVRAYGSGVDAFAAKLNSSGALTWNTFLGAGGSDYGYGVAVDASGDVYVSGNSSATWGAPTRAYTSGTDAFAAKLTSSGGLTWNSFLGGSGSDAARGVVVDNSGNVYLAGFSSAAWGSPVRAYGGGFDMMAAKLNSSGSLLWNSFMGGSGYEVAQGLALDSGGNIYLVGYGDATWGSPVAAFNGASGYDAIAVKITNGGALTWNTFMGANSVNDLGNAIAVDGSGNVYVSGSSTATWGSPVQSFSSGTDAFAAQLDNSGGRVWNTFLGGSGTDVANGIAVDGSGNVYAVGSSTATWGSPLQAYTSGTDAFVAKINPQTTLSQRISLASDDAEEEGPTGTTPNKMWLNSSDIELVSDFDSPTAGVQQVGLRFTGMNIPVGATITNAYLVFRAISPDSPMTNSDVTNLTLKGQLTGNASTFTTTSGNISSRALTSASTAWAPSAWTTGLDYSSPDITSVIQEIVNQGTWASGNALAIIITGTGHRAAQSYDSDPSHAAQLVVTYTTAPPVNSAPVLDNSGTMSLATISENGSVSSWVANVIASAGGDRITDVDAGAVEGIAITGVNNGNGTWRYSTDGGSTWLDVGTVSNTSALLLRATDYIYYVGDSQNGGTADFTFRAWDQTSGTQGTKVDTSINGGTSAFSTATEMASITTTDVNDAPFMPGVAFPSTNEDVNATVMVSYLAGFSTDVDTGALKGLAIVGTDDTHGTWQYTLNGTNWFNIGSVSTSNALLLAADATSAFRFVPNANWNGSSGMFSYKAWDQTTGTAGTYVDASVSGGTTAFSGTSGSALNVIAVNDAPTITSGSFSTNLVVAEDSGFTSLGLGSVVWGPGGGADEASQTPRRSHQNLSQTVGFRGNLYSSQLFFFWPSKMSVKCPA